MLSSLALLYSSIPLAIGHEPAIPAQTIDETRKVVVVDGANWQEMILKRDQTSVFVYFEQNETNCVQCRRDATPLHKLARECEADARLKVIRVDCTGKGRRVCNAFGVGRIAPIPSTFFISKEKAVYKYVQKRDTVLDYERVRSFIEEAKYLDSPKLLLDASVDHFVMVNEGGLSRQQPVAAVASESRYKHGMLASLEWIMLGTHELIVRWFIFQIFDSSGLGWMSQLAQVVIGYVLLVIPLAIFIVMHTYHYA